MPVPEIVRKCPLPAIRSWFSNAFTSRYSKYYGFCHRCCIRPLKLEIVQIADDLVRGKSTGHEDRPVRICRYLVKIARNRGWKRKKWYKALLWLFQDRPDHRWKLLQHRKDYHLRACSSSKWIGVAVEIDRAKLEKKNERIVQRGSLK